MTEIGRVTDITERGMLIVKVHQCTACDGCHKCENCTAEGENRELTVDVLAENRCGAEIGDTVELETATGRVLWYAFLVFIFPFLPAAAGYLIADLLTSGVVIPIITAFSALTVSYLILRLTVDRKAAKRCEHTATKIL